MKDRNKKLMIVVGVLLFVIGVSFAYFVSTVLIGGTGARTKLNTASINGATIEVKGTLSFNDLDIYPGHQTISGIELIATGEGEFVPYNLVWNGTNSLNTPLNFTVYKSESEIETSATCNKTTKIENGAQILAEECSITNKESLGSPIYNGTINKDSTKVTLSSAEFITATSDGNKVYYYVILEYPNLDEEQNIDIGGSFSGKVTVEENNSSADITIASIYIEENDDYKEVERIPEGRYVLNEEKSTCTNNAKPIWNEETQSIQVNSLTTSGTECNIYYDIYVDTEKPIISNVTTSVTKTEINVTVTASDNEGVTEYYYQIDSQEVVKVTENTYQFTGLTAGSTHTIKVYVKDATGNQSDITTKSVTTQSPTASETILGNITYKTTTPDFSQVATTDEGVYRVSDGMYGGYSYYWRGAVTTNHVIFANKCWRIVRVNGDGSIRLIYNGLVKSGSVCTGNVSNSESVIMGSTNSEKHYSTSDGKNDSSSYVGWTYTLGIQRTTEGTASNAKIQTEKWYDNNIGIYTSYASNVDMSGKFCNDRNVQSGSTWASQPSTTFYYAAKERLQTNKTPTLNCPNGDMYALKIGALTADEISFAGGVYGIENSSYYLYNGQYYWTMSPYYWYYYKVSSYDVAMFSMYIDGNFGSNSVTSWSAGLRPVINLKSDVTFSDGNGTQNNPYVVS